MAVIRKTKTKKILISILSVSIIAATVLAVLELTGTTDIIRFSENESAEAVEKPVINLDPPTEQEAQAGNEIKQTLNEQAQDQQVEPATQEAQPVEEPSLSDTVTVAIVDASQYGENVEVRAFASNIVEDGTCDIVFTKQDMSIRRTVDAFADASTTPCINISIPRPEFPEAGQWNVSVTYKSSTKTGSATTSVELQ